MEKKENSLRKKEKKRKETPAELISLKCACQIDDNIMKKKVLSKPACIYIITIMSFSVKYIACINH